MKYSREELLICAIARMIDGCRNIAVGTASPIPGAAALMIQALSKGVTRVSILGSNIHSPFNDGGPELFDRAGQGRIDAFFLGGGQIDGEGNINLVGTGPYPKPDIRFPGSFGSAYLYFSVPRVILFREEHSRRIFVDKVDFISAPGWSPPNVYRRGGPYALITSLCIFRYDQRRHRFRLDSILPGTTLEEIRDNTGFDFDCSNDVIPVTPPEPDRLELIRTQIVEEIAETYPEFARIRLGWDR
ncbi:MAG: 3-oxoadipate CoA-transferase subunit B [Alphaproteobacteria bacterium MarineAlpha11_Bin1]|nr:MAG: 3-oxoadipate CoA-transferase subunit B [Alphaproteobacteria bacterium MarineAlpha11_Bin1]|tara:strand:+ start:12820 stop:13551 length:732 start_codon:yes stop_codon:yes gene_type:complete